MSSISKINFEDAVRIANFVEKINIKYKDNHEYSGFLLYNFGAEDYQKRLKISNDISFLYSENGKIISFVLAYKGSLLKEYSFLIKHEKNIIREVLLICEKLKINDFVWGEQIGVISEKRRKGFGELMLNLIFNYMKTNKIKDFFCMVSLCPNTNTAGLNFLLSEKKFNIVRIVQEVDVKWAILHRNLKEYEL